MPSLRDCCAAINKSSQKHEYQILQWAIGSLQFRQPCKLQTTNSHFRYLYPAISEGYRCCCKAGEESPDSAGQPIPLTAGHPGNRVETVPQKITATLFIPLRGYGGRVRVKTGGKSSRWLVVRPAVGKPWVLKCHV